MSAHLFGVRLEPFEGRVRVRWHETLLADTTNAVVVREGAHPPRHYLPLEDVRSELLQPSARETYCPLKGFAQHWSLAAPAGAKDIAWSYPDPLPGMEPLAGLIAFYQERVQVDVDDAH